MSDDSAESTTESEEEISQTEENDTEENVDEESVETDSDTDEDVDDDDVIQDQDFVRLSYTARSVDSEQLVDTTDEEVAEEEGVDTDERTFEPRVIALGANHIFPSVESAIVGKQVGDSGSVNVSASESFGEYDPEDVRTVSADKIPEDDRYPGAQVEIDGDHGYIETIIGGRARVDFNHPLAGEEIQYEFEIIDRIDDRVEQAQGLLGAVVDADLDLWIESATEERPVDEEDDDEPATETVDLEVLYIESVPQLAMNQQWLFQKRQIAQNIIDRVGVDRIIVQETIEGMGQGMSPFGDIEAAIDDVDVDAEEIAEEIEEEATTADEK